MQYNSHTHIASAHQAGIIISPPHSQASRAVGHFLVTSELTIYDTRCFYTLGLSFINIVRFVTLNIVALIFVWSRLDLFLPGCIFFRIHLRNIQLNSLHSIDIFFHKTFHEYSDDHG